jgi:hypothetical protein
MSKTSKREVRAPRSDEPLDPGWRPFDPAADWSAPALEDDRWRVNAEALYYWRPTFWDGNQHRMPAQPSEQSNEDRFLELLRREVPELGDAIAESERRWGAAHAFGACEAAARRVLAAYAEGDDELALRIVTALLPALDEDADTYSPTCVSIAFLEHEGWYDETIRHHIERWPVAIRDDLRAQQEHRRRHDAAEERRREGWNELPRTGRGQSGAVLAEQLRALQVRQLDYHDSELDHQLTARVFSNRFWLYRHPIDSLRLAWRYRAARHPWRTIRWLHRPRWVGSAG